MNLTEKKFSKFALVREMMETPGIVKSFRPESSVPFLPAFKKKKGLFLTGEGSRPDAAIDARVAVPPPTAAKKSRGKAAATRRVPIPKPSKEPRAARPTRPGAARAQASLGAPGALPELVDALRRFRLEEAKRHRVPAFRILTDLTLLDIATRRPRTESELAAISGIGASRLERYGARILEIVRREG